MEIYLIWLAFVSIILFFAMGIDKQKAKKARRRISEKSLFALAVLGGAVGGTIGMHLFHHKTKHWYFRYGFPLIAAVQIVLIFVIEKFPF